MSFFQKSDKLVEVLSVLMEKGYLSKDIYDTMRFAHLSPEEKFINTYCFANARSYLYTGIAQWERMVDTLSKWKTEHDPSVKPEDKPSAKPENAGINTFLKANYNPVQVDEIIKRWIEYDKMKPPFDPENMTWIINHGWRYNRSLMHFIKYFDPAHTAALNSSFGINGRTFEALNEDVRSLGNRELEMTTGKKKDDEGWHVQSPISKK
jgi:hypothetical protein